MVKIKKYEKGDYIMSALNQDALRGNVYMHINDLAAICKKTSSKAEQFEGDLNFLVQKNLIHRDEDNCYLTRNWEYEIEAANCLRKIMADNKFISSIHPDDFQNNCKDLCEEQMRAVAMALTHRLSVITGGAGSGKTTIIKHIVECNGQWNSFVLCAPTGKAARNLQMKTGYRAATVHSALSVKPEECFISPEIWKTVNLVVVDEASMLTLPMLAGILGRTKKDCHIVFVGDPNQLQAVGPGNVIADLIELGFPTICLQNNHRQSPTSKSLIKNVVNFDELKCADDFSFDNSCALFELDDEDVFDILTKSAADMYKDGCNVQVITPFKGTSCLSVKSLNEAIRELVNPAVEGKLSVKIEGKTFRDGDRVIITKNDYTHDCCNGDTGIIHIYYDEKELYFTIALMDGRHITCYSWEELLEMELAYAITIHKAQGSEYDGVLMPLVPSFSCMLNRNLLYTAISRAKEMMVIFGSEETLSYAVKKSAPKRNSALVRRITTIFS